MSNTTIHINLEGIIFKEANAEFSVGTVDNLEEAKKIIIGLSSKGPCKLQNPPE